MFFKISPTVAKDLGYFCENIGCQKLAQSGHTGLNNNNAFDVKEIPLLAFQLDFWDTIEHQVTWYRSYKQNSSLNVCNTHI